MDPRYSSEVEDYRDKIRAFLGEHLPTGWKGLGALDPERAASFTEEWRATLYENGLLAPSWPRQYGGSGLSPLETVVVAEELYRAGVPTGGPNDGFGIKMVGNTLLHWGNEQQKTHFLPRILSGADRWCQGYSEPGSGSDLASLGTRAVLDGDEWVINGQKIWTSAADAANWIFVLTRTDPDASKHKGITFLLVPMDQPGVEIRPIRKMTGGSGFYETFFTDARTPKDNVVGAVSAGWSVAMTLLGYERGEAAATMPIMFRAELDRLFALARETGRAADPVIRQRLASAYAQVEIMRFLGMRTLTKFVAGGEPGPGESIFKLYWSEYHRALGELAVDLLGAAALTPAGRPSSGFQADDVGAPNSSASWVDTFLSSRAETIYAGTSQVQRNIIGEMVLGLPKEPAAAATGQSWRETQQSVGA